jgi:hypothetical protein
MSLAAPVIAAKAKRLTRLARGRPSYFGGLAE